MKTKLGAIDHIGIAVSNLDEAKKIFCDALGIPCTAEKTVPERGVRIAFLSTGNTTIELLEGIGENSAVSKFVAQRGPGIHHLCFEVDDAARVLAELDAGGLQLVDTVRAPGRRGETGRFPPPEIDDGSSRRAHRALIRAISSGGTIRASRRPRRSRAA